MTATLVARPLHRSVDDLVGGRPRAPMVAADSKSGARFERVMIDGERHVLKYQDVRDDWLMRATGDLGQRFVTLWASGLLDAMPPVIDPVVVGCAVEGHVSAVLMRDVSATLLPLGDVQIPLAAQERYLDHMAAVHAAFRGWRDDVGLTPLANRYLAFAPAVAQAEADLGSGALVPRLIGQGWAALPGVAPRLAAVVLPLLDDLSPLYAALCEVPHTFVHGDWKAANIGSHADGRTVLLDWGELAGEASPLADLSIYLALNSARLPVTKEATIACYRAALGRHGVSTRGWWERALALELLAGAVQFGWEKALGGPGPELSWWEARAIEGARWLPR